MEIGVGAFWYTFGVYRWNGIRESLKSRLIIIRSKFVSNSGSLSISSLRFLFNAINDRSLDCVYISVILNSRKEDVAVERMVYLILVFSERFWRKA